MISGAQKARQSGIRSPVSDTGLVPDQARHVTRISGDAANLDASNLA
jgi:hypothetical protein